jgi:hypothetical protein
MRGTARISDMPDPPLNQTASASGLTFVHSIPAQSFEESKQFYSSIGWTVKDVAPKLALVESQDVHSYIQDF